MSGDMVHVRCGHVTRTSEAKLNNFCRLEPTLRLLEISFDTNVARDVMNERQGTAARLMYELFVALNKKMKKSITGTAMETMRPSTKLEAISSVLYQEASLVNFISFVFMVTNYRILFVCCY